MSNKIAVTVSREGQRRTTIELDPGATAAEFQLDGMSVFVNGSPASPDVVLNHDDRVTVAREAKGA